MSRIVSTELIKLKHSPILWITFAAFALGPIMGGLAVSMLSNPEKMESLLATKAEMMAFSFDWQSYLTLLSQVTGVGGIIVFGFVASWLFGREYSDHTANNLLALPSSRSAIINAKFITYFLWCFGLVLGNVLLGLMIGYLLGIPGFETSLILPSLRTYLFTFLMVVSLGTPISFMGLWGKGYMAPIGLVVMLLVMSQIIGAMGMGQYFPWAVPGLYSGISIEMKGTLNSWSFVLIMIVSIVGFISTHIWWNKADQY